MEWVVLLVFQLCILTSESYRENLKVERDTYTSNDIRDSNSSINNKKSSSEEVDDKFKISRSKAAKFLNLITWVRFSNDECGGTTGDNGTCYTAAECEEYGGTAAGTCASGFGVCCILQYACGTSTNKNSTYFVNDNFPSSYNRIGQCSITVEKVNKDVCQHRLDFDIMDIQQPDLSTHQCTIDRFVVTGGSPVPIICGYNTGQHMYIDAGSGNSPCTLTFITTGDYNRTFKMKVTQIECGAINRAFEGCLQYYNEVSGVLSSFNYNIAEGLQLSNQDYTICIRNERGFCGISYQACGDNIASHAVPESFTITGTTLQQESTPGKVVVGDNCTTDWVAIPCATTSTHGGAVQFPGSNPGTCVDRMCGEVFCSVTDHPNADAPCAVYSYTRPFTVRVHFDTDELGDGEGETADNRGFCLNYVQQPCI